MGNASYFPSRGSSHPPLLWRVQLGKSAVPPWSLLLPIVRSASVKSSTPSPASEPRAISLRLPDTSCFETTSLKVKVWVTPPPGRERYYRRGGVSIAARNVLCDERVLLRCSGTPIC